MRTPHTRSDAAALEKKYQDALTTGKEAKFRAEIEASLREHPDNVLVSAWAYRLGLRWMGEKADAEGASDPRRRTRHWTRAVVGSLVLAGACALFSGGRPPVPVPGEAHPLFWLGWSPLTALALIAYLSTVEAGRSRLRWHLSPAFGIIAVTVTLAFMVWNRTDQLAVLSALHLPFAAWGAVGCAVVLGRSDLPRQGFSFILKSAETALTGGIYLVAGAAFLGLTHGLFATLGVRFSQTSLQTASAFGVGAVPILALASVYDPTRSPENQNGSADLGRLFTILMRLILPLALAVLVVYVVWFIPPNFWRPFQQRSVLIVYNATIIAVITMLALVIGVPQSGKSSRKEGLLRRGMQATAILTLLLNAYALAAIVSRAGALGLTPNRYAVLGWNVATLLMLAVLILRLSRVGSGAWQTHFIRSITWIVVLSIVWTLHVLLVLPLSFL